MKCSKIKWVVAATAVMILPLSVFGQKPGPNVMDPELFMTPDPAYTRIGKRLAVRYRPELDSMAARINREIKPERFEILKVTQTPMAGIGFWTNPSVLAPDVRYLAVAARVNIKLTYFPDNVWGRVGDALDAFGKDLLYIMGSCLSGIEDNSVRGVVLVLIFSRAELNDPEYFNQAEALMIYVPRATLNVFNSHRLSVAKLFDQSELYLFQGPEQIQFMLSELLHG